MLAFLQITLSMAIFLCVLVSITQTASAAPIDLGQPITIHDPQACRIASADVLKRVHPETNPAPTPMHTHYDSANDYFITSTSESKGFIVQAGMDRKVIISNGGHDAGRQNLLRLYTFDEWGNRKYGDWFWLDRHDHCTLEVVAMANYQGGEIHTM